MAPKLVPLTTLTFSARRAAHHFQGAQDTLMVIEVSSSTFGGERVSGYEWLNCIQAVGDGTLGADGVLVYEVFEVRSARSGNSIESTSADPRRGQGAPGP